MEQCISGWRVHERATRLPEALVEILSPNQYRILCVGCAPPEKQVCDISTASARVSEGRNHLLHFIRERVIARQALVDGAEEIPTERLDRIHENELRFVGASADGLGSLGGFMLSYDLSGTLWNFTVRYQGDCSTKISWGVKR